MIHSITPEPSNFPLPSGSGPRDSRPAPREDLPGLVDVKRPGNLSGSGVGRQQRSRPGRALRSRRLAAAWRRDQLSERAANRRFAEITPQITAMRRDNIEHEIPGIYKLRVAPDRARLAQQQGGTQETEAAVNAALNWLAGQSDRRRPLGRIAARRGTRRQGPRTRSQGGRRQGGHRRQRAGPAGLPRRRPHASRRRVPGNRGPRPRFPDSRTGLRWQPGGRRRALRRHVLPRHGDHRAERSVRPDQRRAIGAAVAASHQLHARLPAPHGRRLALSARRSPGRHQPARLAAHGPAQRQAGGHCHSPLEPRKA